MKSKKIPLLFSIALIIAGLLSSCVQEYLEADGFSAEAQLNPTYSIPAVKAYLSASDFMPESETVDQFLELNDEGYFELSYKQELYSLTAPEQVDIPDQLFEQSIRLDETELINFNFALHVEIARDYKYGFVAPDSMHLDYLVFSGGEMRIQIQSEWAIDIELQLVLPGFTDENGNELILDFGNISEVPVDDIIALGGYSIDLTNNQTSRDTLIMEYSLVLDQEAGQTSNADDEVSVVVTLSDIAFESVEGYFGKRNQVIEENTFPMDFTNNLVSGEIEIENPQFNIFYTNSFGIPVQFDFTSLYAINAENQQEEIIFSDPALDPIHLSIPAAVGDSIADTISITGQNSNLFDVILSFPKSLTFGGQVDLNAGVDPLDYAPNFLPGDGKFDIAVEFRLPLSARFNFFMQDTMENPINTSLPDVDMIERIFIKLDLENTFPIDIGIQIYWADSLYNIVDSAFTEFDPGENMQFVLGSSDGSPVASSFDLNLPLEKVKNIAPAKWMFLNAAVTSAGFDTPGTFTQITDQFGIEFALGIDLELNVDPTELGGGGDE